MHCAKHPNEETSLSCGRCEMPICTRCSVHTDVGIRCRDCAPARPSRPRRGASVLLAVIVIIGLIVLGTSLARGDLSLSSGSRGQDVQQYLDEQIALFSGVVTVNQLVDPWAPMDANDRPSPGRRFVALEVVMANQGDRSAPVYASASMFKLTDTANFAYEPVSSHAQPEVPRDLELAPGEKARGWLTFEVDEGKSIKSLTYWTVNVPLPR